MTALETKLAEFDGAADDTAMQTPEELREIIRRQTAMLRKSIEQRDQHILFEHDTDVVDAANAELLRAAEGV